jgi:hypothetical protein
LTLLISIFNSITHIPLVEALQMMGLKIWPNAHSWLKEESKNTYSFPVSQLLQHIITAFGHVASNTALRIIKACISN